MNDSKRHTAEGICIRLFRSFLEDPLLCERAKQKAGDGSLRGVLYATIQVFLEVPLLHWRKLCHSGEIQVLAIGVSTHHSRRHAI